MAEPMKNFVPTTAVLSLALLLPAGILRTGEEAEPPSADEAPELLLLYSGNAQGQLEPCG